MRTILGPYMQYFLWSLALGLAMAVAYDVLRLLRRVIPTCDIVINLEDIGFLIIGSVAFMLLAYKLNNGVLRMYSIASAAGTFGLYRLMVGRRLVDVLEYIYTFVSKLVVKTVKILYVPIRIAVKIVVSIIDKSMRLVYNKYTMLKLYLLKKE